MTIFNLTPHAINIVDDDNNIIRTIEPAGTIARVSAKTVRSGEFDGIPLTRTEFGEVVDLPEPTEDTVFVVSSIVASRVPHRSDVFIPNESVRDEKGRIVGCRSLGHI